MLREEMSTKGRYNNEAFCKSLVVQTQNDMYFYSQQYLKRKFQKFIINNKRHEKYFENAHAFYSCLIYGKADL